MKAPVYKAPVVASWNWTGFYIGGNVGYGWAHDPTDVSTATTTTVTSQVLRQTTPAGPLTTTITNGTGAGSGTADLNGAIGGIQAGYNWQLQSWLIGVEADFQWSGQKGSIAFCATAGCPAGSLTANADYKLNWFGTVRGRLGLLATNNILVYGTGGLAYGHVNVDATSGFSGSPLTAASSSTTRIGWTVGAGVEALLSEHWSAKLEYLYMDLGSVDTTLGGSTTSSTVDLLNTPSQGFHTVTTTTTTAAGAMSSRIRDNIVRVGLNYRF